MKIDINQVWDDAKGLGRANKDMLSAIAGMFLLLPSVLVNELVTAPPQTARDAPSTVAAEHLMTYLSANAPLILGYSLVSSFGALAMLALLLRPERPTVAQSLRAGLFVLPAYFAASLLQNIGVITGMILFLVPGLYLIGRFALIAPVAAAEGGGNPLTILRRSFELTRGNGWRVFALLAILCLTVFVLGLVANTLVGLVAALLLPADVADLLLSIVSGLVSAVMAALIVLVSAALYRAATAAPTMPWLA